MTHITAVVADMHQLFVEGFEKLLQEIDDPSVDLIAKVHTSDDLMEVLEAQEPDILFMELSFRKDDGLELISTLRKQFKDMRICVLSGYIDHKFVKEAFQNGADGYYSKYNSSEEILECINTIMDGETFLASGLQITPRKDGRAKKTPSNGMEDRYLLKKKLTRREQEVLELITKAMNNKEIADKLYISDQTVGVHRKNIMRKLNVRNTVNLIKFALDHQLV